MCCCRNCGWNLWTWSDSCMMRKRFCHCGKRCRVNRLSCSLKTRISLRKPARTMVQKHNGYFWSEVLHRSFSYFFFNIHCIFWCAARDRILSNLQNHAVPHPAPELQKQKAPVAEIPSACLTDSKAATDLIQTDLNILQEQARYISIWSAAQSTYTYKRIYTIYFYALFSRIAVACEAQQVASEQELLESLPLLYKNQPEQVTMALECKGKGGQPCQGAANISVTVWQRKVNYMSLIVVVIISFLSSILVFPVVWAGPETGSSANSDNFTV